MSLCPLRSSMRSPPLPLQGGELSYLCNGYMTAQPFPSFSKGGVRGGLSEMSQPLYSPEGTTDYRQGHRPCIMALTTQKSRRDDRPCASVPSSLRDLFLCRLLAGAMPLPGRLVLTIGRLVLTIGRLVLTIVFCRPFGTFCRSLPASRGPCVRQSDNLFPKLFFLVFIGFFSGRFAVSTDRVSDATMSLHPYSTKKLSGVNSKSCSDNG